MSHFPQVVKKIYLNLVSLVYW